MSAIDVLIVDLQAGKYSSAPQNVIAPIADFIAALQFIAGGLSPSGPEAANTFYAGPAAGVPATPTFRAIINADLATTLTPQFASLGINTAAPATAGQVMATGATTTSPGFYAELTGDAGARVRVGLNSTDIASIAFGVGLASRDLFLERAGAANLRMGSPDAAAPVAQIMSCQNVVGGTANTAGANFTLAGSQGTGSAAGGSLLFQTSQVGGAGSAQNPLATIASINPLSLTVTNVATNGVQIFNTADQVTNYEALQASWVANLATIQTLKGGTGTNRNLALQTTSATLTIRAVSSVAGSFQFNTSQGNSTALHSVFTGTWNQSSGVIGIVVSNPTFMQTGTAGYAAFLANVIEATTGSGTKRLFDGQISGASKFNVDDTGLITTANGTMIASNSGFTNNAGAQIATLTNGPTAGNPTKWIPINDNGTIRNIPAW
jgi:uncharacterized spore protein YtfJ